MNFYNLVIMDESGSMECMKTHAINSMKGIIDTTVEISKKDTDNLYFLTLMTFNTEQTKYLYKNILAQKLSTKNDIQYEPDGGTPLYDAIGDGVNSLNNYLKDEQHIKVLVTIITDGEENSSIYYNAEDIKALTTGLKKYGWEFSYIGTNHNVKNSANKLSISNHYKFNNSKEGYIDVNRRVRYNMHKHSNFDASFEPESVPKVKK